MKSFFPATLLARKNGKVIILLEVRCDASRDLVPVVQFKNYEKHPWRSVISESVTPPWVFFTSKILQMVPNRAKRFRYITRSCCNN